jgi:hypothetical protein
MSPSSSAAPTRPPRWTALYATAVCVLAAAAAVVSFVKGSWLMGIVWVLLAGLSSNMAWYYARRTRAAARAQDPAVGASADASAEVEQDPAAGAPTGAE